MARINDVTPDAKRRIRQARKYARVRFVEDKMETLASVEAVAELAGAMGVSERTVWRDMAVIREYQKMAVIQCPDCGGVVVRGASFEGGRPIAGDCPKCDMTLYFAPHKPHPFRPMTMRDGSTACADCYAPPSHEIHKVQDGV